MIKILLTGMFAKLKRLSEQMNNASLCQVWNFPCMTLAKWQKSSLICITIRTFCCEYATIPCTDCNQLLGAALTIAKLIAKIVRRAVMIRDVNGSINSKDGHVSSSRFYCLWCQQTILSMGSVILLIDCVDPLCSKQYSKVQGLFLKRTPHGAKIWLS
jgi:hypothetical protein